MEFYVVATRGACYVPKFVIVMRRRRRGRRGDNLNGPLVVWVIAPCHDLSAVFALRLIPNPKLSCNFLHLFQIHTTLSLSLSFSLTKLSKPKNKNWKRLKQAKQTSKPSLSLLNHVFLNHFFAHLLLEYWCLRRNSSIGIWSLSHLIFFLLLLWYYYLFAKNCLHKKWDRERERERERSRTKVSKLAKL